MNHSGLVWGLGTVLGPVVGGGFELYTWRWAFYINLLFGAFLLPTYLFVLPSNDPLPGASRWQKLASFDWVGSVISIGAFTTLVMGINFGGTLYAWSSGQTIALFVVSGVLWIIFGLQQGFEIATSIERRILPIHLFAHKEPILLFISCAAVGAVSYISVYYIPIYFQFTQGDDAIKSAVRLLPFIFLLITTIPTSGAMMSRLGYYKPWYLGGSIIAFIPAVLMCKLSRETSFLLRNHILNIKTQQLRLSMWIPQRAWYMVLKSCSDSELAPTLKPRLQSSRPL